MGRASRARSERGHSPDPAVARPARWREQWARHGKVARFSALFLGSFALFQVVYYGWIVSSAAFAEYLRITGIGAAAVLRVLGEPVETSGDVMAGAFAMSIRHGCDGLQAIAIVVLAIAVFPASVPSRLVGAAAGALAILALNFVRIATLFWAGAHWHAAFQPLHVHIWPAALIAFAVVFWVAWATFLVRPAAVPGER